MGQRLKRFFLVCFLLPLGLLLRAQETTVDTIYEKNLGNINTWDEADTAEVPEKEKFRFKNRMVELSLANLSVNLSNDYFTSPELIKSPFYMLGNFRDIQQDPGLIWQDPIVINIDDLSNGFRFDAGIAIKPVSLNFNWKDEWGVGLDVGHTDIAGNVSLSGNMITLKQAQNEKTSLGAAAFTDVGIPVFFHYHNFKIKIRPAAYVPLVYAVPNITYSHISGYTHDKNGNVTGEWVRLEVDYDMRIYSVVNMQNINISDPGNWMQYVGDNVRDIARNNVGYDFGLGVEYLWNDGLDIGLDIVNIPVPFAAAKLNHYAELHGNAFFDSGKIDLPGLMETGELPEDVYDYPEELELQYGHDPDGKKIYRPFKTLLYAHYRPFESPVFSLIPSVGFSINHLYQQTAAVEGGLSARFDIANIFITTIGINYNDRKWKNSLDFVLNLRAFELDFGVSLQSPDFLKSFQRTGAGINAGVKIGW